MSAPRCAGTCQHLYMCRQLPRCWHMIAYPSIQVKSIWLISQLSARVSTHMCQHVSAPQVSAPSRCRHLPGVHTCQFSPASKKDPCVGTCWYVDVSAHASTWMCQPVPTSSLVPACADTHTGDPLHSRALAHSRAPLFTQPCSHCSHSRAPGEQWARLCVFTLHGCVQDARLCRGSPVTQVPTSWLWHSLKWGSESTAKISCEKLRIKSDGEDATEQWFECSC